MKSPGATPAREAAWHSASSRVGALADCAVRLSGAGSVSLMLGDLGAQGSRNVYRMMPCEMREINTGAGYSWYRSTAQTTHGSKTPTMVHGAKGQPRVTSGMRIGSALAS